MFVIPATATPDKRWLAHLVRASAGAIRSGDRFDDELPFEPERVRALARRHRAKFRTVVGEALDAVVMRQTGARLCGRVW